MKKHFARFNFVLLLLVVCGGKPVRADGPVPLPPIPHGGRIVLLDRGIPYSSILLGTSHLE